MLFVLKRECGEEFTNKIEGMMKDMSTSKIVMEDYVQSNKIEDKNFEIKVLTQGNWPIQSRTQIKIPDQINSSFEEFASYYKMKYQGKALKWSPILSFCEIEGTFDMNKPKKRIITIEVSLIQTAVLMLYNTKDTYSFEEIMAEIATDEETLESVLVSMCSMQYKILKKSNKKTRNVKSDESFTIDDGFRPKLKKISISAATKKQTQQESEESHSRVLEERK